MRRYLGKPKNCFYQLARYLYPFFGLEAVGSVKFCSYLNATVSTLDTRTPCRNPFCGLLPRWRLITHRHSAWIRIGFAPYLNPNFNHDHVVTEWHDGQRWIRSDPEIPPEKFSFDTMDMPATTFVTAGELWQKYLAGQLDDQEAQRYGVSPDFFTGPPIMRDYVVRELLALDRHELLLWDNWGLLNSLSTRKSWPSILNYKYHHKSKPMIFRVDFRL